ncbi:phospholipase D family protein [Guyparkeria sp.]|uniref:phospholipase D family protein n=1 Tax=Guyparkeria sp. TaxID=2035736 RepID=UPI003970C516
MKRPTGFTWMMTVATLAASLAGCALPTLEGRSVSTSLEPEQARATSLGQAISPVVNAHPGQTGTRLLYQPLDAFATWARLAREAECTLDMQYYIWSADVSGIWLFGELLDAAERDVRVRLLLDDMGVTGLDQELAALDAHPNIEVRLFNPFVLRNQYKWLGFLTDLPRVNRRMHEKVFIADNQVVIIGGRNINDKYFGAEQKAMFFDLDVLTIGPLVDEVSRRFDRFWASPSSYPVDRLLPAAEPGVAERLAESTDPSAPGPAAAEYRSVLERTDLDTALFGEAGDLVWTPAILVADEPSKGLGAPEDRDELLTYQLREILETPTTSIDVISSFFVPTPTVTETLTTLAGRGVRVRVLTNSLEATDMPPVHAGYSRYRKALVKGGVELYEMYPLPGTDPESIRLSPFGHSGTTLHAKAIIVDGRQIFLGSYNVDPRSVNLNTELGLVIDSPEIATQIDRVFNQSVPATAYEVRIEGDDLYWLERTGNGETIRHDEEPGAGFIKRGAVLLFSLMPIEWLL